MIRKQIVGFSNYEVSECGRVFSLRRKHNQSDIYDETEIELKVQHIDDAYCILGLTSDEGKRHMKSVHRLVAGHGFAVIFLGLVQITHEQVAFAQFLVDLVIQMIVHIPLLSKC